MCSFQGDRIRLGLEWGCAEGREGAEIGGVRGCGEMRVEIVGGVKMK